MAGSADSPVPHDGEAVPPSRQQDMALTNGGVDELVPTSAFLQELLQQRKAEDRRSSNSQQGNSKHTRNPSGRVEGLLAEERAVHSSPPPQGRDAPSQSQSRRTSGTEWKRGMGLRESEEVNASGSMEMLSFGCR